MIVVELGFHPISVFSISLSFAGLLKKKEKANSTHKEHKKVFPAQIDHCCFVKLSAFQCRHTPATAAGHTHVVKNLAPELGGLTQNHQTLWIVVLFLLPMH